MKDAEDGLDFLYINFFKQKDDFKVFLSQWPVFTFFNYLSRELKD